MRRPSARPGWIRVWSRFLRSPCWIYFPSAGSIVIARRSPGALTVIALSDGVVTIVRSLELAHAGTDPEGAGALAEIIADLYPTLAYIEDQTGSRPAKMFIAGFGREADASASRLARELDIPVESLDDTWPGSGGLSGVARTQTARSRKQKAAA